MSKVEIKTDGTSFKTEIFIDGKAVEKAREVSFRIGVDLPDIGNLSELIIKTVHDEIHLVGEMKKLEKEEKKDE